MTLCSRCRNEAETHTASGDSATAQEMFGHVLGFAGLGLTLASVGVLFGVGWGLLAGGIFAMYIGDRFVEDARQD